MSLSWIAQVLFFTFYFIAWLTKELPQTTWIAITAISAIVIAVLLVVDNRGLFNRTQA